jgi:hypothetical protein
MPRGGWRIIQLREEYDAKLKNIFQRKRHQLLDRNIISYTGFVNDLIWHVIEADELLLRGAPFLSVVSMEADGVTLRDAKLDRIVQVKVKKGKLVCELDNSTDCIHVGFAYAIPEVYHVMEMS